MSVTILSAAFLFGYFLSCYGWGRTAVRALGVEGVPSVACYAAIGLSIWSFLGGVANLLEIATPATLLTIYAFGLALAVPAVISAVRWTGTALANGRDAARAVFSDRFRFLAFAVVGIVLVFLCATLLPSTGFNPHDDFHAYMVRPARMLATGTMFGNPFDVLGLDTLGAQAFFHGFILLAFPIDHLNGFDTILCFGLSLFLLIDIGRRFGAGWPYVLFSLLAFVSIHPQLLNIGALYSGSLMILTLVYVLTVLAEKFLRRQSEPVWREVLLLAAPLATLLALKNSFVVFAATFMAVFFVLLVFRQSRRFRPVLVASVTAGSTFLLLLPWLLANAPNYILWLQRLRAGTAFPPLPVTGDVNHGFDMTLLLSPQSSRRGGSFLVYLLVVILIVAAGTLGLLLLRKASPRQAASLLTMVAGSVAVAVSYFALPLLKDPYDAVRYATPLLIALWPVAGLALVGINEPERRANLIGPTIIALQIIILIPFFGVLSDRLGQAVEYRTMTSFPIDDTFIDNNKRSVGESGRALVRTVQATTERGATILAWIGAPFHLDFARNKILSLSEWGVTTPWLDFPFDGDERSVHEYLRTRQIRYLIWEYDYWARLDESLFEQYAHFADKFRRSFGQRHLALNRLLPALVESRLKIYDDGHIVVVDLRAPPPAVSQENPAEPGPDAPE